MNGICAIQSDFTTTQTEKKTEETLKNEVSYQFI
jgi:hypothetical protein